MEIYSNMAELAFAHVEAYGTRPGKPDGGAANADCPGDEVFVQALRDDSNQELDWLWTYVQVTGEAQRRYCLERALAINPKSEMALRELAQLRARWRI
jgi:hypothetical protein